MVRYETLLLTVPELTADEAATLEKQFEKTLVENKASLISFERWGKYKLSYPVQANEYGIYFLTRFEIPNEQGDAIIKSLHTLLSVKHNELVMRHMTCHLNPHAPLSYHRPESLEEVPTRDVETFLKESKMTGLLHNKSEKARSSDGFKESENVMDDLDDDESEEV